MEKKDKNFIKCKACGKPLIERMPNGLLRFIFGKNKDSTRGAPVHIIVFGSVKMKCFRADCECWNVINLFPGEENDDGENHPGTSDDE